jgi:inner membrane protein
MPSAFTHAFVGAALGTLFRRPGPPRRFWLAGAACAAAPDLDVVGPLWLGVPWRSMLGHRGISHSLAFAVVLGAVVTVLAFRDGAWRGRRLVVWLYLSLVTASHGLLDAMNDAVTGVAFFAPFDATRYLLPWRPLPVSPFAFNFFSARGFVVFQAELLMVWLPAVVLASLAWAWRALSTRA